MYLVRMIEHNEQLLIRMCNWEESYDLLPATREMFDEKVVFARMFTNKKRAEQCADLLRKCYETCKKMEE